MLPQKGAALEAQPPAGPAGSAGVIRAGAAAGRQELPAQMGGAGRAGRARAQQQQRNAAVAGPQAQTPAGGEIEVAGIAADLGDHRRHRPAGQGLLGGPEQFGHVGGPHQDEPVWRKAEIIEPGRIGQAEKTAFSRQLQMQHRRALLGEQGAGLGQGKAQPGGGLLSVGGENLLHQPALEPGKTARARFHLRPRLGQRRLALDIGNGRAQRRQALLTGKRGHGAGPCICEQNRNIYAGK